MRKYAVSCKICKCYTILHKKLEYLRLLVFCGSWNQPPIDTEGPTYWEVYFPICVFISEGNYNFLQRFLYIFFFYLVPLFKKLYLARVIKPKHLHKHTAWCKFNNLGCMWMIKRKAKWYVSNLKEPLGNMSQDRLSIFLLPFLFLLWLFGFSSPL